MSPDAVLGYWLGADRRAPPERNRQRWWSKSRAVDDDIRHLFGDVYESAVRGELDGWASTPRSCVALLVLLDQFSRNLHRDHPRAFRFDPKAQRIARGLMDRGQDRLLEPSERLFLYMPLMHAEDLGLQEWCKRAFQGLCDDVADGVRANYEPNLYYAERHREIIERFGRFPHRNVVLGRPSTDAEIEFLMQPGSSF